MTYMIITRSPKQFNYPVILIYASWVQTSSSWFNNWMTNLCWHTPCVWPQICGWWWSRLQTSISAAWAPLTFLNTSCWFRRFTCHIIRGAYLPRWEAAGAANGGTGGSGIIWPHDDPYFQFEPSFLSVYEPVYGGIDAWVPFLAQSRGYLLLKLHYLVDGGDSGY